MSASDHQRPVVPVLAYFSSRAPLPKIQNPAANRSLRLATALLFVAGLIPILRSTVLRDVLGGVLAGIVLVAWIGLSVSAVIFGAEGFIKSREPRLEGALAAAVGFSVGLAEIATVIFQLLSVVTRP